MVTSSACCTGPPAAAATPRRTMTGARRGVKAGEAAVLQDRGKRGELSPGVIQRKRGYRVRLVDPSLRVQIDGTPCGAYHPRRLTHGSAKKRCLTWSNRERPHGLDLGHREGFPLSWCAPPV